MSLEVINPREDSVDESNPKFTDWISTLMTFGGAIHVGVHFENILYGVLMFLFLELMQALGVVCSMTKDEFATFVGKRLESKTKTKDFLKEMYYKYIMQSWIALAIGYFGVRLWLHF